VSFIATFLATIATEPPSGDLLNLSQQNAEELPGLEIGRRQTAEEWKWRIKIEICDRK